MTCILDANNSNNNMLYSLFSGSYQKQFTYAYGHISISTHWSKAIWDDGNCRQYGWDSEEGLMTWELFPFWLVVTLVEYLELFLCFLLLCIPYGHNLVATLAQGFHCFIECNWIIKLPAFLVGLSLSTFNKTCVHARCHWCLVVVNLHHS